MRTVIGGQLLDVAAGMAMQVKPSQWRTPSARVHTS
jgi:hypothetical protein